VSNLRWANTVSCDYPGCPEVMTFTLPPKYNELLKPPMASNGWYHGTGFQNNLGHNTLQDLCPLHSHTAFSDVMEAIHEQMSATVQEVNYEQR